MTNTTDVKSYHVSHSKMAAFRRCKQQYAWKYIDHYFPPSSMGQARGTAGHAALGVWHVDYDQAKAMEAAWQNWQNAGYQNNEDWQQLETALSRYFVWSLANDTFKLKIAEQEFNIEYDLNGETFVFNGFIDGVVEEKGQTWLLENKFYKRMDNNDNSMDMQVSLYLLAAHLLGYEANGVIYNKVRVGDTKIAATEPVVRTRLYRNPQGLERIQNEMLIQVADMIKFEKEGGVPYRNPTKDCSWDCAFFQACLSMTDDGQDPTDILKTITNLRSTEND
jgi:hypothetical protein